MDIIKPSISCSKGREWSDSVSLYLQPLTLLACLCLLPDAKINAWPMNRTDARRWFAHIPGCNSEWNESNTTLLKLGGTWGQWTSVETSQTNVKSVIGNGMSLSMNDEGGDFSRTSSVLFSRAAANPLKSMLTFSSTCNAFTCRQDNASAGTFWAPLTWRIS